MGLRNLTTLETTSFIEATFSPLRETIDSLWGTLGLGTPQGAKLRRIAFLSPRSGDGTTTLAACAAIGLSRHLGDETLLVEANPSSPRLAAYFKLPSTPGFAELVGERCTPEEAVRATELPRLSAIVAGNIKNMPAGSLAGPSFDARLDQACAKFERVIFDLPALFDRAEARTLLWKVDAAVLVLRSGHTSSEAAELALQQVRACGIPVIGTVLNRHASEVPRWLRGEAALT